MLVTHIIGGIVEECIEKEILRLLKSCRSTQPSANWFRVGTDVYIDPVHRYAMSNEEAKITNDLLPQYLEFTSFVQTTRKNLTRITQAVSLINKWASQFALNNLQAEIDKSLYFTNVVSAVCNSSIPESMRGLLLPEKLVGVPPNPNFNMFLYDDFKSQQKSLDKVYDLISYYNGLRYLQ